MSCRLDHGRLEMGDLCMRKPHQLLLQMHIAVRYLGIHVVGRLGLQGERTGSQIFH